AVPHLQPAQESRLPSGRPGCRPVARARGRRRTLPDHRDQARSGGDLRHRRPGPVSLARRRLHRPAAGPGPDRVPADGSADRPLPQPRGARAVSTSEKPTTAETASPGQSPSPTVEQVDVPLRWIDEEAPAGLPAGAVLGAPLPRGVVTDLTDLGVVGADGTPVPAQLWPLATWPDGSVKW